MNGNTSFVRILRSAMQAENAYLLINVVIAHLEGFHLPYIESIIECLKMINRVQIVQCDKEDINGIHSAALIRKNSSFYICFNRDFLLNYVRTCDDLSHLVLHELGHKLRGDLRRDISSSERTSWKLVNLVADMLNDAALRRHIFHEPPGYLRILYDSKNLFQLLAPPEVLLNKSYSDIERIQSVILRSLIAERFSNGDKFMQLYKRELAEIYCDVWLQDPSFKSIYYRMLRIFNSERWLERALDGGIFLGSHKSGFYVFNYWDKWFFSKKFSQLFNKKGGYGVSLHGQQIDYLLQDGKSHELLESIKRAVEESCNGNLPGKRFLPEVGVVPFVGRKEAFLLSGGHMPILYKSPVLKDAEDDSRLSLYIDVSYSIRGFLPFIYSMLVNLRDEIREPIYLFSNKVVSARMYHVY